MKILMIGNQHSAHSRIARELRALGHRVDLVWDSEQTASAKKGFMGGMRFLYEVTQRLPQLSGYDVVQLSGPQFLPLAYGKLMYIYKELKKRNGHIGLTVLEPGYVYTDAAVRTDLLRFSIFRTGKEKSVLARLEPHAEYELLGNELRDYTHWLLDEVDGVMALAPEYAIPLRRLFAGKGTDKVFEAPRPVDVLSAPATESAASAPASIRLCGHHTSDPAHGRTALKLMAERIAAEAGEATCRLLERDSQEPAAIVLESLTSYSPGIDALEAMARGAVAVTGAQPEYYEAIGADETDRPIVCGEPLGEADVEREIRALLADRELLGRRGEQSRRFVMRHHNPAVAARIFERYWNNVCLP